MTILPKRYARTRWDEEHAQKWIGETFLWTDRDSYLAWVIEWKAELASKIATIREARATRRDPTKTAEERSAAQSERHYLRIECANLFLLRMMAKKLSVAQRNARLTMSLPTS